uniref:Phosphatidylinositol-specific phospholipase C X domain-containing protein n=1 Tax=Periophthalmus magnuspinnatus TaxID=409849 RepID=A0A3B4BHV7_9GOBI
MEPDSHPDWMSRLPGPLLQAPLWDLAIPGSHDSMSFCLDMSSPVLKSEPALLRLLDCLFPCCTRLLHVSLLSVFKVQTPSP